MGKKKPNTRTPKTPAKIPPNTAEHPPNTEQNTGQGGISATDSAADRLAYARRDREKRERWERIRKDARGRGMSGKDAIAYANQVVHGPPDTPPPPVPAEPGVQGLGDFPGGWPELPANASLQTEIAWVAANRLHVVRETPGGAVVDLAAALSPPPSHAAIGWLETSIRAYSKYCDIAARATQTQEHEAEQVRHERMRIDEVRGLLEEMLPPGGVCAACGRLIKED